MPENLNQNEIEANKQEKIEILKEALKKHLPKA